MRLILLAICALALTATGCQKKSNDDPKTGQACHVTGGDNKGKSGRYDKEGDCCDADTSGGEVPGGWGCTSCKGTDKCADGAATGGTGGADQGVIDTPPTVENPTMGDGVPPEPTPDQTVPEQTSPEQK